MSDSHVSPSLESNDSGTFSAPWHRGQCMSMSNYVASDTFPDLCQWLDRDSHLGNLLVIRDTQDAVFCTIVGMVSSENIKMQPQGNYTKQFGHMKLSGAKLQFTLKKPTDALFASDFDLAIDRLQQLQADIAVEDSPSKYFILTDDRGNKCLRMSYPIFESKNKLNDNIVRRTQTSQYPIGNEHKEELEKLVSGNKFMVKSQLRVHRNKTSVKLQDYESDLIGALVEVTFSLKHYAIGSAFKEDTKSTSTLTNVFTSVMHQVVILEDAPPPTTSPYESSEHTGPIRIRQVSPRKNKNSITTHERTAAANTFGPPPLKRTIDPPAFVEGSSTGSETRQGSMSSTERTLGSDDNTEDNADVSSESPRKRPRRG